MELSGAEIVVQTLIDEGVEYVFGYPGGAVLHIYDALFSRGLPTRQTDTPGRRENAASVWLPPGPAPRMRLPASQRRTWIRFPW